MDTDAALPDMLREREGEGRGEEKRERGKEEEEYKCGVVRRVTAE